MTTVAEYLAQQLDRERAEHRPKWQDLGQARTNAPWYQTEEQAIAERAEWRRQREDA